MYYVHKPLKGDKTIYTDKLVDILNYSYTIFINIVKCGYLNIDYLANSIDIKHLCDKINCYDLHIKNTEPTKMYPNCHDGISCTKLVLVNILVVHYQGNCITISYCRAYHTQTRHQNYY